MKTATTSVEFSFNNIMYRQIDGVAMGSPLGPAVANVFIGYCESKLFNVISKPTVYFVMLMTPFLFFTKKLTSKNFLIVLTCFTAP